MFCIRFDRAAVVLLLLLSISNARGQTFTKVTTGALVNDVGAWRSVNWVDYDSDGDLDLFVTSGLRAGRNNLLYRNEARRISRLPKSPPARWSILPTAAWAAVGAIMTTTAISMRTSRPGTARP